MNKVTVTLRSLNEAEIKLLVLLLSLDAGSLGLSKAQERTAAKLLAKLKEKQK